MAKNLPAMQEIRVQFLGQEDPLEKEMPASSSMSWEISWTEVTRNPTGSGLRKGFRGWDKRHWSGGMGWGGSSVRILYVLS